MSDSGDSYKRRKARNELVVWFGGSFSPPIFAHRSIILAIYDKLYKSFPNKAIKIVFMPTNRYYSKPSVNEACIKESERLDLVKLMVEELNNLNLPNVEFSVSDFEIKNGHKTKKATPTFLSVRSLEKQFGVPSSNIYIVLRQFNFEALLRERWIQPIALLERYNFILLTNDISILYDTDAENRLMDLYARDASEIGVDESPDGVPLRSRLILVDAESRRMSSASVRRSLFEGTGDLATLTIDSVGKYIKSHKLYKSKACLATRRFKSSGLSRRSRRRVNENN